MSKDLNYLFIYSNVFGYTSYTKCLVKSSQLIYALLTLSYYIKLERMHRDYIIYKKIKITQFYNSLKLITTYHIIPSFHVA